MRVSPVMEVPIGRASDPGGAESCQMCITLSKSRQDDLGFTCADYVLAVFFQVLGGL